MRACQARGRDAPLFGLFRTISWRRPWGRKRARERRREEDARRGRRARRSRGRPRQSRTAGAPSRAPCGGGGEKTVVFCQYLDTVRFIRDLILSKTGRARAALRRQQEPRNYPVWCSRRRRFSPTLRRSGMQTLKYATDKHQSVKACDALEALPLRKFRRASGSQRQALSPRCHIHRQRQCCRRSTGGRRLPSPESTLPPPKGCGTRPSRARRIR